MTNALVSVVTPTYNHGAYIIDCIRSVQAQTYPHWEMLIVNDGSPDNTAQIVAEYIQKSGDTRIRLFNQENVGIFRLGETYNFALEQSKGEFVAILEGDDLWEPQKLERQVAAMTANPSMVLSWGMAESVKDDLSEVYGLHPLMDSEHRKYYSNSPPGMLLNLLFIENCLPALTILIRKKTLLDIGGFQQSHNLPLVDMPTTMALSLKGAFHFDDFLYGKWRIFPNQATKTYPMEIIKGRYALVLEYCDKLPAGIREHVYVTSGDIHRYFDRIILIGYSRSGRYKLIRGNYPGAREDYIQAIFSKGPLLLLWRIRSIIGWWCGVFHINVEWLAKLIGRRAYK